VVRLPDNSELVLVPGQAIEVGRDDGPLVALLADTTTVSRRHATLALTPTGVVTVVDHTSTNGTFVNGGRCPPSGPVEVPSGAEVAFSRGFPVTVEVVR
jgi:pSer/pThr/pTyr-binding forkhead associated (FHA) protein